jgi:hypothetical protein
VGGAKTAETPALHSAGKALALGHALDVDHLAGDIVAGGQLGADVEKGILGDDELGDARFRLHFSLAEMAALRLGDILGLGGACAELDGRIAVAIGFAARHDLNIVERQDGDRHVAAVLLEQAGHPHFLRDHAGAHDHTPSTEAHGQFRGRVQPETDASPRWAVLPAKAGMRGTQTTANAVRYPYLSLRQCRSWIPALTLRSPCRAAGTALATRA